MSRFGRNLTLRDARSFSLSLARFPESPEAANFPPPLIIIPNRSSRLVPLHFITRFKTTQTSQITRTLLYFSINTSGDN